MMIVLIIKLRHYLIFGVGRIWTTIIIIIIIFWGETQISYSITQDLPVKLDGGIRVIFVTRWYNYKSIKRKKNSNQLIIYINIV